MSAKYYIIEVIGGIEPILRGPFDTTDEQEQEAKRVHAEQDPETDATFWLDVFGDNEASTGSYSGGFFAEEEDA